MMPGSSPLQDVHCPRRCCLADIIIWIKVTQARCAEKKVNEKCKKNGTQEADEEEPLFCSASDIDKSVEAIVAFSE
jgi:hypothetical protein